MISLVSAFPALNGRAAWSGNDSKPFKKCMRGMSTGEGISAQFVLHVWNRHENKFDLGDAVARLDHDNLNVIRAWLNDPWFM